MYYVDTPTQRIDVFDFQPERGAIDGRRMLVAIPAEAGSPDGLAVDVEGGIWVALWGGSAVRRYTPEGHAELEVRLPVTQVTSCAFGGPAFAELYITTAANGLSPRQLAEQPGAGGLFRCRPGVAGLPPTPFGG